MRAQPLPGRPALSVRLGELQWLCVGDLHIGLESEMRGKGVHMPSQTERMISDLEGMSHGHDGIIVLGDVKHRVPGTSRQESAELPQFFMRLLRAYGRVEVVRGNHDTDIAQLLPEGVAVHPPSGMHRDEVGFVHGHTWPGNDVMACPLLVMGHNHPAVIFEDGLGNNMSEKCWMRCRFRPADGRYLTLPEEAVIVPPFNRNLGGSPVNLERPRMLGPLFRNDMVDLDDADLYLMDGVYLGKVRDLRVRRQRRFLQEECDSSPAARRSRNGRPCLRRRSQ
jgi:putative SbcD/Mre11-related phosphoesterase